MVALLSIVSIRILRILEVMTWDVVRVYIFSSSVISSSIFLTTGPSFRQRFKPSGVASRSVASWSFASCHDVPSMLGRALLRDGTPETEK